LVDFIFLLLFIFVAWSVMFGLAGLSGLPGLLR
jgi:hypothetical protein